MFDIGFSELVVIGLIALIVLGPKRLPEVARTAGRWMGQLRRFVGNVKQDFDREIQQDELAELRKLRDELNSTRSLIQNTSGELIRGFTEIAPAATVPVSETNTIHSGTPGPADHAVAGSSSALPAKRKRAKRKKPAPAQLSSEISLAETVPASVIETSPAIDPVPAVVMDLPPDKPKRTRRTKKSQPDIKHDEA
jgi:sec-independent protein translocase protein TatB